MLLWTFVYMTLCGNIVNSSSLMVIVHMVFVFPPSYFQPIGVFETKMCLLQKVYSWILLFYPVWQSVSWLGCLDLIWLHLHLPPCVLRVSCPSQSSIPSLLPALFCVNTFNLSLLFLRGMFYYIWVGFLSSGSRDYKMCLTLAQSTSD